MPMEPHDICLLVATTTDEYEDVAMVQAGAGLIAHIEAEHGGKGKGDGIVDVASVSLDNAEGMAALAADVGRYGMKQKHLAELIQKAMRPGCPMLILAYAPTPKAPLLN